MRRLTFFWIFLSIINGCSNGEPSKPVEESIADIGELEVMHYDITIMGKNSSSDAWYKSGARFLMYSADAHVTGFVNLKNIGWENISRPDPADDKTIVLTIPHLTEKNLFVELNEKDIRQEFMKVGMLRSRFTPEEQEEIKRSMQSQLQTRIKELGLIEETEAAAAEALKVFCSNLNYNLSVKFEDKTKE